MRLRTLSLLLLIGIFFMVFLASLYQDQSEQPKLTAEEYFEIPEESALYVGWKEDSDLLVSLISFDLIPIKGDAHEVFITNIPGMTPEIYIGTIKKREVKTVEIELNMRVYIHPEEKGFPFQITITCVEARGKITIYLQL